MEYKYTINDISATVKISKPSLYALIKKNSAFIKDNSIRKQRKIYYNQAVMDFFISYYSPEGTADIEKKALHEEGRDKALHEEGRDKEKTKAEKSLSESSYREEEQKARIDALHAEIGTLHAEIDTLRKQLDDKEEERKELLRQNGALILTISQLQTEKQLLLPAPKQSIGERVKGLFHKS